MSNLRLEVSDKYVSDGPVFVSGKAALMITPAINEDYWIFRVMLHGDQAIVGFPKFGTIGIGFAQEEDWNTNLPYTCNTKQIYAHIEHNKKYAEITEKQCLDAIQMIRDASKRYMETQQKEQMQ